MTDRIWRSVIGYESNYSVSSDGLVRRDIGATRVGICRPGRILKFGIGGRTRYHTVRLFLDGRGTGHYVHRLVCEAFNGPCPEKGFVANHIDGNRWNNRFDNLEWISTADNNRHAFAIGIGATGDRHWTHLPSKEQTKRRVVSAMLAGRALVVGERSPRSKLTDEAVHDIRSSYIPGKVGWSAHFASKYGVDKSLIYLVVQRKIWKHI